MKSIGEENRDVASNIPVLVCSISVIRPIERFLHLNFLFYVIMVHLGQN